MESAPARALRRHPFAVAAALVCVAAAVTWSHAVGSGLLESWDDDRFIIDNHDVRHPSLDGLVSFFTEPHMEAWHPLHLLSYWIDVPWLGIDGPAIHVTNVVLWVGALVLVLAVMVRLGLPLPIAVLATLLYGLHPTQVEVVTWATGRKDVLACLFSSAAILCHLRSDGPLDRAAWASRAMYVLAAMSKTTVLPLPLLLVLIDVLHRELPWKTALIRQVPSFVLGGGLAAVVVTIWQGAEMIRPDAAGDELGGRILLVLGSVTHHLRMAVLPLDNAPLYPIHRQSDVPFSAVIGPALLAVGAALAWRARDRHLLLALGGFVVLLLPVMNIIPMYWHWMDRYLSLPLLMLAYGAGVLVQRVAERKPARFGAIVTAAGVLAALLAGRTWQHQMVYTDDLVLWGHATSVQPGSYHGWVKLGEVRRDAGDLDGSIDAYERAIEIEPALRLANTSLFVAVAMRDEQRHDLAERAMELGRRYYAALDDVEMLRTVAGDMVSLGYRDAVLLPLGRSFDLSPVEDGALLHASAVQRRQGNLWLAEFYESRMRVRPAEVGPSTPDP